MRLTTPEIVWHSKQPVFTADFHKNGPKWRLATGGGDNDVKLWKVTEGLTEVEIIFLSNLSRHSKAVNIVRFSPNGEYLASAGDDNVIFLWSRDAGNQSEENNLLLGASSNKENWSVVKTLRGHLEDIYDLCWSCDSCRIITGSVDNSAIVWDVLKGQQVNVLKESRQFVQGVSWDPLGKFVATLSNDRNLRVYGTDNKFRCVNSISKLSLPDQDGSGKSRQCRMWIDEGLGSFFRRLCFTPDGSFLIVPAGRFELANQAKNATYVFARSNWSRPVLQLPGPEKPTVVVKCCPIPFQLKLQPDSSVTNLPYRMVYAVASMDAVFFYDTQHSAPFAHVSNIHYSGITDLAWSNDGLMLIVTSSDCYCSIITFEPNELGNPLEASVVWNTKAEVPTPQEISAATSTSRVVGNDTLDQPPPILPLAGACSPTNKPQVGSPTCKPRRIRPTKISEAMAIPPDKQSGMGLSQVSNETAAASTQPASNKTAPRRVNLITLSSFKTSSSIQSSENSEQ